MTSRFNVGHIKVTYSAPTHLFNGENVVLLSDCTVVVVVVVVVVVNHCFTSLSGTKGLLSDIIIR